MDWRETVCGEVTDSWVARGDRSSFPNCTRISVNHPSLSYSSICLRVSMAVWMDFSFRVLRTFGQVSNKPQCNRIFFIN